MSVLALNELKIRFVAQLFSANPKFAEYSMYSDAFIVCSHLSSSGFPYFSSLKLAPTDAMESPCVGLGTSSTALLLQQYLAFFFEG